MLLLFSCNVDNIYMLTLVQSAECSTSLHSQCVVRPIQLPHFIFIICKCWNSNTISLCCPVYFYLQATFIPEYIERSKSTNTKSISDFPKSISTNHESSTKAPSRKTLSQSFTLKRVFADDAVESGAKSFVFILRIEFDWWLNSATQKIDHVVIFYFYFMRDCNVNEST